MEQIEAGLLKDLKSNIKKLIGHISNVFKDWDLDLDEPEVKGDTYRYRIKTTGGDLYIYVKPIKDSQKDEFEDVYDVTTEYEGAEKKFGRVNYRDVARKVDSWFKDLTGTSFKDVEETREGEVIVKSSKGVKVKVKKVLGAKEDSVEIVGIKCSVDPSQALSVVNDVLDSGEFLQELPEGVSYHELTDVGSDNIEIAETEEFEADDPYLELLKACYYIQNVLKTVHWNAKGRQFARLHNLAEEYLYKFDYQIDTIAEWAVQYTGYVMSPCEVQCMLDFHAKPEGYTYDEGNMLMKDCIKNYMDCMLLHYSEFPVSVKTVLDSWISESDKVQGYLLSRPEVE